MPANSRPSSWRRQWVPLAKRAFVSGSVASVVSTLVISLCGRRRSGSLSAGTNATSHWLWGDRARHRAQPSLRHTAVGYAIHHASSVFWAVLHERAIRNRHDSLAIASSAGAIAAVAYVVDYHVVPRRLNPGFESRLSPPAMLATYSAFGAGLGLGALIARRVIGGQRPGASRR